MKNIILFFSAILMLTTSCKKREIRPNETTINNYTTINQRDTTNVTVNLTDSTKITVNNGNTQTEFTRQFVVDELINVKFIKIDDYAQVPIFEGQSNLQSVTTYKFAKPKKGEVNTHKIEFIDGNYNFVCSFDLLINEYGNMMTKRIYVSNGQHNYKHVPIRPLSFETDLVWTFDLTELGW